MVDMNRHFRYFSRLMKKEKKKKETKTKQYSLKVMTHFPNNPDLRICEAHVSLIVFSQGKDR